MKEGIAFAHERGVKCYLTINIFAHNRDIQPLREYLEKIKELNIDAFIVSDPGIICLIQEIIPDAEIHLSTQANMTNYQTANFWYNIGVKRIVLARELSFEEMAEIRQTHRKTSNMRLSCTARCAFPIREDAFSATS